MDTKLIFGKNNLYIWYMTVCENYRIELLSTRIYFSCLYMFVTFINFFFISHKSTYAIFAHIVQSYLFFFLFVLTFLLIITYSYLFLLILYLFFTYFYLFQLNSSYFSLVLLIFLLCQFMLPKSI